MAEPRRNLVFCRAGEASLHRSWLGDAATRSYDVWLDCWCDPARWAGEPAKVTDGRGTTKWPRLAELLAGPAAAELERYDAVWFPDDDLRMDAAAVEEFFAIFHRHRLALAQPALDDGRNASHAMTVANPAFVLRRTNFVEVMAPAFSREALKTCAPIFSESKSGWGLDFVWPRLLDAQGGQVAIVDATPMTHTRKAGAAYELLPADKEMRAVAARHGVAMPFEFRHYGGVLRPRPAGAPRNLVLCRVGESSLHRSWIGDPATRSYDAWLDCYCDPARWAGEPAKVTDGRGTTKWPRIASLLTTAAEELSRYDLVWFPDDDVRIDAATLERFFDIFHRHHLALAQPALVDGCYWSHEITLANRGFVLRRTNFVEVMAPAFSREALNACARSLYESRTGWGLDVLWSRALADLPLSLAIVDATPMTHAAAGGYQLSRAGEEMQHLAARCGVTLPFEYRHFGGVPRLRGGGEGPPLKRGLPFAARLVAGAPRSQRFRKLFWKRMLPTLWRTGGTMPPADPGFA